MTQSLIISLVFYLSLTPSFFFGWAVSKMAYKRIQINVDTIRMLLLVPVGTIYLLVTLNFVAFLSDFLWFKELEPIIYFLQENAYKACRINPIYKDVGRSILETGHILFLVPVLYLGFLVYIPYCIGKYFSQAYFSAIPLHVQFNNQLNEIRSIQKTLDNDLKKLLERAERRDNKKHKLKRISIGLISYFVKFLFFLYLVLVFIALVERVVLAVTLIKRFAKFLIEFMTKNLLLQELETTEVWGFYVVSVDISTSENKITSGVLKSYHLLPSGELSYFTLEKVYKRERVKRFIGRAGEIDQSSLEISEEFKSVPLLIPGKCLIVPLDKVIDFNVFRSKRELLLNIDFFKLNFFEKDPFKDFDLNSTEILFIKEKIQSYVSQLYTGRICYTKTLVFYPKNSSEIIEPILSELISGITFVSRPEFIEYSDQSEVTEHLKEYYSLLERMNYKIDLKFCFVKNKDGTRDYGMIDD